MSLEALIAHYGAAAVFIGAALEGETAAFLGGVLAHRHLMAWWQAAAAACFGSFAADQLLFFAGRYASRLAFVRHFTKTAAAVRVNGLLEAHPNKFILGFRFIYGIRTISPIAIGLSNVKALRFVLLNLIAALAWGLLVTSIGYLFGGAIEAALGRLTLHLHLLVALVVFLAVAGVAALVSRKWLFASHRHIDNRTESVDSSAATEND